MLMIMTVIAIFLWETWTFIVCTFIVMMMMMMMMMKIRSTLITMDYHGCDRDDDDDNAVKLCEFKFGDNVV